MVEVICFLFPAFVGIACLNSLEKKVQNFQTFIATYGLFVILINIASLFTIDMLLNGNEIVMNADIFTANFTLKFLALSSVYSIALGFITKIIRENVKLKINVEKIK